MHPTGMELSAELPPPVVTCHLHLHLRLPCSLRNSSWCFKPRFSILVTIQPTSQFASRAIAHPAMPPTSPVKAEKVA